jgi:hypothetical protein
LLSVVIAYDKTSGLFLNGPRRREAALRLNDDVGSGTAVESGNVREDDPERGTMDRDIHRRNVVRLEQLLRTATDDSEHSQAD